MSKHSLFVVSVIIISILFAIFFGLFQHYELYTPLNTQIFGDYGDFISGGLSVVSIYLLVETLKQQMNDSKEQKGFINKQIQSTNHQIKSIEENNFNSLFFGLLRHLQKEIEDLNTFGHDGQSTNKDYFEALRQRLQESFQTTDKYQTNISQAIHDYTNLYVANPRLASYFRLLYRICELTDNAPIGDNKKKEYVKILRAQLTGSELLLLRYSAQTSEGKNFRTYINKYNLLKHLPIFELLEFKQWWGQMQEYERYQVSVFADSLKYCIKEKVRSSMATSDKIQLEGWELDICIDNNAEKLTIQLNRQAKQSNNLFSTISPEELQRLLQCILSEIFSFSNFEQFRKRSTIRIEGSSKPSIQKIGCYVESLDKLLPLSKSFPAPKDLNFPGI